MFVFGHYPLLPLLLSRCTNGLYQYVHYRKNIVQTNLLHLNTLVITILHFAKGAKNKHDV